MKNFITIGLAFLALLLSSSTSAYERQWTIEMSPPTWNMDLFETEAHQTFYMEESVNGLLQAVPAIAWRSAHSIHQEWAGLKAINDPTQQLEAIRRSDILASACDELIDFRSLAADKNLPIRWRDNHRGRTWIEPTTASTLLDALESFQDELPGYTLMLGDMAQPGCGQLEYGTLVSHVQDGDSSREATKLLDEARMISGVPAVREFLKKGKQRTFIEKELIGHSFDDQRKLTLRVASRTYRRHRVGPSSMAKKRLRRWIQAAGTITYAETRRVLTTTEHGRSARLWRQHWIAPERETQVILFSTRRLDSDRPLSDQLTYVREMRFSRWDIKKPLSYKGERRFVRRLGSHASRWEAWALVHEAGHQTHTSGRDVDISYVTNSNHRHFNGSWKTIDARRTWKWFQLLVQSARNVGSRVERILVGPRIHRILRRRLPKKTKQSAMFRTLLRRVDGHDAHHHLRISPSEHLPLVMIPWLWRVDEPLQDLLSEKFSQLHR